MPPEESAKPLDWLSIARLDFDRTQRALRDHDPGLAGFCLQQSVEKFLKAFVLSKGGRVRRTHDLEALLDEAVAHDSSLEYFRSDCQMITTYYTLERYPFADGAEISEADVKASIVAIHELIQRVELIISRES